MPLHRTHSTRHDLSFHALRYKRSKFINFIFQLNQSTYLIDLFTCTGGFRASILLLIQGPFLN
ncbi:hypothetical protein RchiOBHm_Chr7g0180221 [Rosa chinensis]|uniref:Uncharacterized protein n=1 Tax=Rosa chinensis TaxID=74649 RepID=A0A2P6P2B7_ROSCH|nr:hypothetical protein RchiOBHm_Chr7g0180221 [Rosa chinensis]